MMRFIILCLCYLSIVTPSIAAEDKPQVLMMMSSHVSKAKGDLLTSLSADQPFTFTNYSAKGKSEQQIMQDWQNADLILLDGINPALSKFMFAKYQPYLSQFSNVPVVSLGDLESSAMNQGLTAKQHQQIGLYYNNAGRENYRNLMLFLSNQVFKLSNTTAKAPTIVPNVGLYHPDFDTLVSADEEAFFSWLKPALNQPVIAIGVHRSVIDYEQQQVVDALIRGLERKGAKAIAFFFEGNDESLAYPDLLTDDKGARVDLLIN